MSAAKMQLFERLVNEAATRLTVAEAEEGAEEEYLLGMVDLVAGASGLDVTDFHDEVRDLIVGRSNPAMVSEITVARSMKVIRDALDARRVRLVCAYPMLGDYPGEKWMELVFPEHVKAGRIHAWSYTDSHFHMVEYVRFTVDVSVPDEISDDDPDLNAKLRAWAVGLVNELVGDSDAEVHFIGSIPEEES